MSGRVSELLRRNLNREFEGEPEPLSEAEKARRARLRWLRDRSDDDLPEWEDDDE